MPQKMSINLEAIIQNLNDIDEQRGWSTAEAIRPMIGKILRYQINSEEFIDFSLRGSQIAVMTWKQDGSAIESSNVHLFGDILGMSDTEVSERLSSLAKMFDYAASQLELPGPNDSFSTNSIPLQKPEIRVPNYVGWVGALVIGFLLIGIGNLSVQPQQPAQLPNFVVEPSQISETDLIQDTAPVIVDPGTGYMVVCKDGWISYSGGKQGACSHHGGIDR